ncbi:MAG: carboxypeptidase regulatory-like domain-containing protein [Deltaproteobacteria bacterium]|nr:carboxypeptidase regulatory-like domain-containing protein [Deltaproteobacteria bacterium]
MKNVLTSNVLVLSMFALACSSGGGNNQADVSTDSVQGQDVPSISDSGPDDSSQADIWKNDDVTKDPGVSDQAPDKIDDIQPADDGVVNDPGFTDADTGSTDPGQIDPGQFDLPPMDLPGADLPTMDLPTMDLPVMDFPSSEITPPEVFPSDISPFDVPNVQDVTFPDLPWTEIPFIDVPVVDVSVDAGPQTFKGVVIDMVSGEGNTPVEGADIVFLDMQGNALGYSTQSGAGGAFEITLPPGIKVGVKVSKAGYTDTYQFGLPSVSQDLELRIFPANVLEGALGSLGLTLDANKGVVAGGVVFINGQGDWEAVGCASVQSEPASDIRYFDPDTDMPTTLENASTTSKFNSQFIAANVTPGSVVFKATVDGSVIGETDALVFAGAMTIDAMIMPDGTSNPTPAGCAQ